eukprot:CAMPEP_0196658464 /NCGR_PEP_ID=MMETSP1086-20130531/29785_1 /TAXON_ID=77921 /ORGANISM="Cyanoptyche  gloeocystis , Strain SAG4.97" /LENGTH=92 /DNA_ID=CAMNT_0041992047 /DNA_START=35 /DNA_END=313 /DNA_ORIENTATION=+
MAGSAAKLPGLMRPLKPSVQLGKFLGSNADISRPAALKKIWAYIKQQDLQDPADRRQINCDSKLADLLGTKKLNMLEMGKRLNPHFESAPKK